MHWIAQHEEDGEVYFRVGRDGDDLVAEWVGLARLHARADGSSHRLVPEPDADPRDISKIERGSLRLLLRHLEGKLALHGAAVVRGGAAVVFLGRARQGKSTLAAALCAHADVALLADDAVAIDGSPEHGFSVSALEAMHWLDRDALAAVAREEGRETSGRRFASDGAAHIREGRYGKSPIPAPRVGTGGRLDAIVDLAFFDGPVRLVRTTPLEAMAALVPQAVRFVLDDPIAHRRELDALGELVETVPVFRLERPRDLSLLPASCDRVLDLLRGALPDRAVNEK